MKLTNHCVREELRKIYLSLGKSCENKHLVDITQAYWEKLSSVEEWVFVKACRQWDKEKFPTALQLLQASWDVKRESREKSVNGIAAIGLVCNAGRYFYLKGFQQTPEEAAKCEFSDWKKVEEHFDGLPNLAQAMVDYHDDGMKTFGLILCPWHQMLAKAKHHSGSSEEMWCKEILEFSQTVKNMTSDQMILKVRRDLKREFNEIFKSLPPNDRS